MGSFLSVFAKQKKSYLELQEADDVPLKAITSYGRVAAPAHNWVSKSLN
jgi:hypothetical protein